MTNIIKYKANVYIWDTDAVNGSCGHASLELVKKEKTTRQGHYIGLWPRFSLLVNPLTLMLASPAKAASSLQHCIQGESPDGEEGSIPNKIYSITITEEEYQQMQNAYGKAKSSIENSQLLYSLFPSWNIFRFAGAFGSKGAVEQMQTSPFSDLSEEVFDGATIEKMEPARIENCSSLVAGILSSGGIKVDKGYLPWGISPLGLSSTLAQLAKNSEKIKVKTFDTHRHKANDHDPFEGRT